MKEKPLIPLSKPAISETEVNAVAEVLRSGWLVSGPKTVEFEDQLSQRFNKRSVVSVSSGTAALHLSLILAGIEKYDEVITTPMTFAATANVILMVGARPVFVDIDPTTWNIDPGQIEKAITKQTRAILPVHFAGRPCNMDKINEIAARHGLKVIEDAAQAFGAFYKEKPIGSGENFVCFSFHPMKQITTIEGGAIVLPNQDLLPLAKRLRFHGIEKDAWKTFKGIQTDVPYDVSILGYKYNMSDISAALGLAQMKRERRFAQRRKVIAHAYISGLKSVGEITLPMKDDKDSESSWNLFHIVLDRKISRHEFMALLKQNGVASGVYYRALHLSSLYRNLLGGLDGKFPNAERFSDQAVLLPIYPKMSDEQVQAVIAAIKKSLKQMKKSA